MHSKSSLQHETYVDASFEKNSAPFYGGKTRVFLCCKLGTYFRVNKVDIFGQKP